MGARRSNKLTAALCGTVLLAAASAVAHAETETQQNWFLPGMAGNTPEPFGDPSDISKSVRASRFDGASLNVVPETKGSSSEAGKSEAGKHSTSLRSHAIQYRDGRLSIAW
jgi:hypothetical protein